MKQKAFLALGVILILAATAVYFNQKSTAKRVTRPQNEAERFFFVNDSTCQGQEENIKNCESKSGRWSCPAQFCFLAGDEQYLRQAQQSCTNELAASPEACFQLAAQKFQTLSKWIEQDSKACVGNEQDIKSCAGQGLQWHCKIGVCVPPGTLPYFETLSKRCQSADETCTTQVHDTIKKLCMDQFKNETCTPDAKAIEMNKSVCSKVQPITTLYTWAPKFNVCADEASFAHYFDSYYQCSTTKTYSRRSNPNVQLPVFNTADECIENLTAEVRSSVNPK